MRIALVVAVAMCLAACEDSGTTAGPGPAGAVGAAGTGAQAGTGVPAAGSTGAAGAAAGTAGTDPECRDIPRCALDSGQSSFIVGSASKEYSSPTCAGRICVPCGARLASGGSTGVHGCFLGSSDGSHVVFCDDSKSVVVGTDCN